MPLNPTWLPQSQPVINTSRINIHIAGLPNQAALFYLATPHPGLSLENNSVNDGIIDEKENE